MSLTIPNTTRIRANADTTVADAFNKVAQYVSANVTQQPGTKKAVPTMTSHLLLPTPK